MQNREENHSSRLSNKPGDSLRLKIYKCAACNSDALKYLYKMSDYDVYKCSICGTGTVMPTPGEDILNLFYDGFLTELKREKIEKKAYIAKSFFDRIGIAEHSKKLFLDLGGGNGLFSYAFERFLYGKSTYIDRDPKSCDFARDELKITEVIRGDVNKIISLAGDKKYDIIYSRHMIEHLPDPFSAIKMSIQLLRPNGIAIFQCPNGDSLEYIAYTKSNLWKRFRSIRQSTKCSKTWLLWRFISGDILHGIDPPRHLWAISKKGLHAWAKNNGCDVRIFTAHLGDLAFSPGYFKRKGIQAHVEDFIGQKFLAHIRGGTHLIAKFNQIQ